jgi:hypothetical protein
MTPTEYGIMLARREPPISDECAEQAARILVAAMREAEAAA